VISKRERENKTKMSESIELLDRFGIYLSLRGIRSHTEFIPEVKTFLSYLMSYDLDFLKVRIIDIENYRKDLLDKKLCYSTINNKINKLRSFYAFLEKKNYIYLNPLRELKGLRQSKSLPKNQLSLEQMETLLNNLPKRTVSDFLLIALIELLYGSAIRISEANLLKVSDLNYLEETITITEVKKGGVRREVPATTVSIRAIDNYLDISGRYKEEYVFPQGEKTTLRAFMNRRLKAECIKHGFKILTSHSFRHSAATSMLRAGAGIREVQAFLGHESILSTQRYTRVIKEDLKKVISKHHPRELNQWK
jgi:site-specific recombinase XerD